MSFLGSDRSRKGRGRSKSPSGRDGRDRSRSRGNVRAPEAPEPPAAVPRSASYGYPPTSSTMPGAVQDGVTSPAYDVRAPQKAQSNYYPQPSGPPLPYGPGATAMPSMPYPEEDGGFTMGAYTDLPPHERPGYDPRLGYVPHPGQRGQRDSSSSDEDLAYGADTSRRDDRSRQTSSSNRYKYTPDNVRNPSGQFEYAKAPEKIQYKPSAGQGPKSPASYSSQPYGQPPQQPLNYSSNTYGRPEPLPRTFSNGQPSHRYSQSGYDNGAQVVDITPGGGRGKLDRHNSSSERVTRLSTPEPHGRQHSASLSAPGLGPRMDRLSVSGNRPDLSGLGGGMPPPSPLLEAYHGTYQSISPLPFDIRGNDDLSDMDDLDLNSGYARAGQQRNDRLAQDLRAQEKKAKKSVKLYDPEEDAKTIASALSHHKVDADAICDTLPRLSHDQIVTMRKEYKKQVKVQGKGVNLSKHINMKLSGNFGKAVYVTALGRWESEGYWANFFYQSHGSRRELLIESLMGRTNAEIRMIKDEFKDKRYSDSLMKCMEKELKMDKFRTAILMALEERRQEEQDVYPQEYVLRDVDMLYRSVTAQKGGESPMLEIIVRRSDAHLKEVLRMYEGMYKENFARTALRKSNNLVGEIIAHILNGVINRPARDALLLQHAIKDIADRNRDDELRYELLVSRLVRIHWDKAHLQRVKKEYWEKYRSTLEDAIEEAMKGDFREFMCELCETK
ncbi:Annexin C1 [Fulvia fulva]|uniref:Annexin C1 n=1 Tax=Passalora fulva TaxID=5499 RepID=A0A9Q8PM81_PASFU|nr:Annexin C1 [Fulvia fulva]KAK4609284.1 Annexin C1 [Fulvia fulva]UJO25199.1 Annexin C1 [Fulvia fulva]WPV22473.1 Annexin C1 [Fulvia fulva]WPV37540.1 Annexin C1 [Fulvia fulva]